MELYEEQEKNSCETLVIWDIREEESKPGYMQMEKWSVLNDVVIYVQYNEHVICHYGLELKAPEESYGKRMYKQLQDGEGDVKEIGFDPNSEGLK